jgi:hypothetical protein
LNVSACKPESSSRIRAGCCRRLVCHTVCAFRRTKQRRNSSVEDTDPDKLANTLQATAAGRFHDIQCRTRRIRQPFRWRALRDFFIVARKAWLDRWFQPGFLEELDLQRNRVMLRSDFAEDSLVRAARAKFTCGGDEPRPHRRRGFGGAVLPSALNLRHAHCRVEPCLQPAEGPPGPHSTKGLELLRPNWEHR